MKLLLSICIILFISDFCLSQITGICIDTLGKPIPYVNIGIKNTPMGTVTNEDGRFSFDNKSLTENNCLVISHMSYITKSIEVPKISEIEIVLHQAYYQLNEVTILSSKYAFHKEKRIGPITLSKHVVAGFYSSNLGTESGKFFTVDKGKTYKVERLHLNIAEFGFIKGTFRINFYDAKDAGNVDTLRCNKNDIILEVSKTGDVDMNLSNENLFFSNSFLTTIEWLDCVKNNSLSPEKQHVYFSSYVFCGPFYYRFNNLAKWTVSKDKYNGGLGIQLFVKY